MWTVPALPLGELDNCLTLQVEGGPKLLEKNRVVGAKKKFKMKLQKSGTSF